MNPIEEYIASYPDTTTREMLDILRHFILSTHEEFREKIAYGIPFFFIRKNICYLNPTGQGVDVGFLCGTSIAVNVPGFELKERKMVKTFHFDQAETIDF